MAALDGPDLRLCYLVVLGFGAVTMQREHVWRPPLDATLQLCRLFFAHFLHMDMSKGPCPMRVLI